MTFELHIGNVIFLKDFQKDLQKFERLEQNFIKKKLNTILTTDSIPNIVKLRDSPLGNYRLRLGKFRLIFDYDPQFQKVIFIACRKRNDLY